MPAKLVNIKLDKEMLDKLDSIVMEGFYASRTEFIRESIRKNLLEAKKQEFFNDLALLKSKIKKKRVSRTSPVLSEKERVKAFKDLLAEKGLKL